MKHPVTLALIGAGARGELNLATLAKKHGDLMKIVAVAELDDQRRDSFVRRFGIPRENAFRDWRELFARPRLADGVVNALPCRLHYESGVAGLRAGYHTFLEKPMALTPGQCVVLTREAAARGLLLMIALQSRYNKIYSAIRRQFDAGVIGRLANIDCAENIGYWHFLLSYVRGIHRRADLSHSFIMAKGVHDLDLVCWFAGAPAKRISSFGDLLYFRPENAPPGAPERCLDGCPVFDTCVFNAYRHFVDPGKPQLPWRLLTGMSLDAVKDFATNPRLRTTASVITLDLRKENILKILRETSNGRCAFRSDNDVIDHQTASIEFENGVVASFQLTAFSLMWERTLNLHGTKGEIRSADFSGKLETRTYNPGAVQRRHIPYHGILHGGGDERIIVRFAEALAAGNREGVLTGAEPSLESHLVCFAAEKARRTGQVVDLAAFRAEAAKEAEQLQAN
ncbi:MAG: Gfo/Idh/MocA family oxidoreductase [Myxococcales bacterium]|nr:Gfo/Idh/MocA family oxidoreductase [Myxococcales bacterium]